LPVATTFASNEPLTATQRLDQRKTSTAEDITPKNYILTETGTLDSIGRIAVLDHDECWRVVQKRDASQDGRFFFGVLTTGVYCKPSCASRQPLRKNVRFYEHPADAEKDGLRPCLRCKPLAKRVTDRSAQRIREVCRYMDAHTDQSLKLRDLASIAGMSSFHFQRTFKTKTGLTPKQYLDARRMKKLKEGLKRSSQVTQAMYEAGYGSSSRVYERANLHLGMTPNQYRRGGKGLAIAYATISSSFGKIMIGATDRGICFLQFGESRELLLDALRKEYPSALLAPMRQPYHPDFEKWVELLKGYMAGTETKLRLPLDLKATVFQMKVWNYLQSIPHGEVQSYGEVAVAIGNPKATRAVARACATNRVALVIPCHRVIRGTGELGGYRWGLARKRVLIDQERLHKSGASPGASIH
jgi:AraC family transcriptional regulator of adaptative response/methylated-DNA-[protein]-cysteine methyltransferase